MRTMCTVVFIALIVALQVVLVFDFHRKGSESERLERMHAQSANTQAATFASDFPLISILASTGPSRADFFKNLWESFQRQKYANKELIVFEDSEDKPSDFWRNISDSRVRYFHMQHSRGRRMGIGSKHKRMMRLSHGQKLWASVLTIVGTSGLDGASPTHTCMHTYFR